MAIDRAAWKLWFPLYEWPTWRCPRCGTGVLQLDRKSLAEKETRGSRLARQNFEDWDPDMVEKQFIGWLQCSRSSCGEIGTVIGSAGLGPTSGPDGELEWEDVYSPRLVIPMPDMISIPAKCPSIVAVELRSAFELYWLDPGAAANRLRIAVEVLLDAASIRRRKRVPGKIVELTLHQRIEELEADNPVIAAHLMAVKWLGNTASHESGISGEALLDAFEIVEHVLEEMVEERSARVAKLARKLTEEHAPKRKSHRKPRKKGEPPDSTQ